MSEKGTRRANGEGSLYDTIQKIDRKDARKNFVCDTCKKCTDWSICNYRAGTNKCQKCVECTECLKKGKCDRFYAYKRYPAQITLDDGSRTTVANEDTKSKSVEKKKEIEAQIQTKSYVRKNGITIIEICNKIEKNKFESGDISENTLSKDKYHIKRIEEWKDFNKPVQKVTYEEVQNFLNSLRFLSQRRN